MFKKYKAFLRNEGQFEQPGARALQDFVNLYDQQRERSRMDQAVWAAEKRVKEAEEKARVAEERVERLSVEASTTASLSSSRPSADTVTRERFFPEALVPPPSTPLPDRPEPQPGPKCAICANYCYVCPNPWQRTRSKIMASRLAEQRPKLMIPYGIALHPCSHVFCGACLAQSIYHSLNLAFDPELYGMKLPSYILDLPDLESPEFPISCPRCRLKMRPGARKLEINDATASLVLGDTNLEEWNHARFLASRR
ncbi:hypothetical protein C8F01DRAFT_487746 [Mycena amicta]|nr:hypothetical protein C8F01DRAFT_487746 [Mycena amicta]